MRIEPRAINQIAKTDFVSLPAWFSVRQARAVLRLKGKRFALLATAGGSVHAVTRAELDRAPDDKLLASCATPLGPALGPNLPVDEAWRHIEASGSVLVPVVLDGLVVGIVAREDVWRAVATAPSSPRLAA